jgi:uncharacterized protein YbbC (DUF1343 family)
MTLGVLATMFNTNAIQRQLTVIPMAGWMRGDWYDSTACLDQSFAQHAQPHEATLYPGVGVVEGTNVSVGRGTDTPFDIAGAPWIRPLNCRNI